MACRASISITLYVVLEAVISATSSSSVARRWGGGGSGGICALRLDEGTCRLASVHSCLRSRCRTLIYGPRARSALCRSGLWQLPAATASAAPNPRSAACSRFRQHHAATQRRARLVQGEGQAAGRSSLRLRPGHTRLVWCVQERTVAAAARPRRRLPPPSPAACCPASVFAVT